LGTCPQLVYCLLVTWSGGQLRLLTTRLPDQ